MWEALLVLAGAGIVALIVIAFWAEIQNWLADVLDRARVQLGDNTHTLVSALVIIDKAVVASQRVAVITARAFFSNNETDEIVTREEVRTMDIHALQTELDQKLDSDQPLSNDLPN